jgi:hypothetical protein
MRDNGLIAFSRVLYRALYVIITVILSVMVFSLFIAKGISGFSPAMFADMVYGKAAKPYVYRALLPATVRFLTKAIPHAQKTSLDQFLDENHIVQSISNRLLFAKAEHEKHCLTEYAIALLVMFLSLLGFFWSLRYLFRSLYRVPVIYTDIVSLAALIALPYCFKYYSHLYDFPTLFLFTLGLGLMCSKQWGLYMIVFILGCLNKETAILLTLLYAVHYRQHMDKAEFKKLLLLQVFIFLFIKSLLTVIFIHNPGTVVEFHLYDHNLQLLGLYPAKTIALWMVIAAVVMILLFHHWSDKPPFLRDGIWICMLLVCCILLFGFLDELRDYYEIYPIVILLIYHSLCALSGNRLEKIETFR